MRLLMIGYDLNAPGKDYADLISTIKPLGLWWHYLDSTWLVKSELSPAQARGKLRAQMDKNAELLVIDVTADARAWGGFDNGRIPAESLCPVAGQPAHRLRCDAAAASGRMATA